MSHETCEIWRRMGGFTEPVKRPAGSEAATLAGVEAALPSPGRPVRRDPTGRARRLGSPGSEQLSDHLAGTDGLDQVLEARAIVEVFSCRTQQCRPRIGVGWP